MSLSFIASDEAATAHRSSSPAPTATAATSGNVAAQTNPFELPAVHFEDAAAAAAAAPPHREDSLITVSLTAVPDDTAENPAGSQYFASSLPDTQTDLVAAYFGGGTGDTATCATAAALLQERPSCPSTSVRSSDLNNLLFSSTPQLAPVQEAPAPASAAAATSTSSETPAAAAEAAKAADVRQPQQSQQEQNYSHDCHMTSITCGESFHWDPEEREPSLSNFSQQPPPDSELVTAATTMTDPLASMLHSTVAPPSSHAVPPSTDSEKSSERELTALTANAKAGGAATAASPRTALTTSADNSNTARAASDAAHAEAGASGACGASGISPSGLTFVRDGDAAPCAMLDSGVASSSLPRLARQLDETRSDALALEHGARKSTPPLFSAEPASTTAVATTVNSSSVEDASLLLTDQRTHSCVEAAAGTSHFKSPLSPPQDSPSSHPTTPPSPEMQRGAATTTVAIPLTSTPASTAATTTSSNAAVTHPGSATPTATSSADITPRATSLPVFHSSQPPHPQHTKSTGNNNKSTSLSTSLVSSASVSSSSAPRLGPLKPPARITAWIRSRVSQNKVRFREGDFNLDLTYITPHIIAMGYPAHGTEYYIRNPIDEVERFFDERHGGHFRIYNLCSERAYDNPRRFHGCFRRFPFDDHNVPPLALILQFVLDAATFLDADTSNVVAIHCKAGKGRTGIMVSCLLYYLYREKFATATDAIRFFDQQRTCDGEGMTIPSQRRYVHYFERILGEYHGTMPAVQRKLDLREVIIRVARENTLVHPCDLYFIISDHQQMLLDSRMWFPRGPTISSAGCVFSFAALREHTTPPPPLMGDVKFSFFRRRPIVLSGKESTACYLWFNTSLCPSLQTVYQKSDLDKVDVAAVGKAVMVSITLAEAVDDNAPAAPAVAAATPAVVLGHDAPTK